jgi:branched-chain amino acid transport system permease protein
MSTYVLSLIALCGVAIIEAVGLNIIMGFCGQVTLGHAAFIGIGAYATGLLLKAAFPLWFAFPAAAVCAGAFGLIIGSFSIRLRGDFLAITTLAVGFLFQGIVRKNKILGAAYGISDIPHSSLGTNGDVVLIVATAIVALAIGGYVDRSWAGLAFKAVRIDEDAARACAISPTRYKLLAFCLGTALAGAGGALYTNYAHLVLPESLGFSLSVATVAMVVVGGIGSTAGVAVGAILLTIMPEVSRSLGDYRMMAFGLLFIFVMRFAPNGIAGVAHSIARRSRP